MSRRALFRVDADATLGGGHARRCLTLADELGRRGWNCIFLARSGLVETVPDIARWPITLLPSNKPMTESRPVADLVVFDGYDFDADDETPFRSDGAALLAIDDLADRQHDCDWLLDATLGRTRADYAELVDTTTSLLLGPTFALLRPAFATARATARQRRASVERCGTLQIALGATDPDNYSDLALSAALATERFAQIEIVLGAAAPHRVQLAARVRELATVRLEIDPPDLAERMVAADLAVGAAGGMSWERCSVGLPTVALTLADNQRDVAANLAAAGAIVAMGEPDATTESRLAAALLQLADDPSTRHAMSVAAFHVCDGDGARRVADAIETRLQ